MEQTARAGMDVEELCGLARAALEQGREEAALPLLGEAAEREQSPLLWQWHGLLARSLEEHEQALVSFARAGALAPADAGIAHGHARVALEAGIPSIALFEHASRLSPADGSVLLGHVASLVAAGDLDAAQAKLESALSSAPGWIEGQMQLAHLRAVSGHRDQARAFLESTIARFPDAEPLWTALFRLLVDSESFAELDAAIARARSWLDAPHTLLHYEIIAACELGDEGRADRLVERIPAALAKDVAIFRIRHLLRAARVPEASSLIDAVLKTSQAASAWPYASIAWRLAGDPRAEWLDGSGDQFIGIADLSAELPDFAALETVLRSLHVGKAEYLDQSVRGGLQTNGPLFTNIDPAIRKVRAAVVAAIERYAASLPPPLPGHPLLDQPRNQRVRFAGSWSVLLRGAGYHSNHVHPQGWISSALYVRVPEPTPGEAPDAGSLTLGEPQAQLAIDLAATKRVKPRPGQLVLFPSYMWHGTIPFTSGERLTVAFDVKGPK